MGVGPVDHGELDGLFEVKPFDKLEVGVHVVFVQPGCDEGVDKLDLQGTLLVAACLPEGGGEFFDAAQGDLAMVHAEGYPVTSVRSARWTKLAVAPAYYPLPFGSSITAQRRRIPVASGLTRTTT